MVHKQRLAVTFRWGLMPYIHPTTYLHTDANSLFWNVIFADYYGVRFHFMDTISATSDCFGGLYKYMLGFLSPPWIVFLGGTPSCVLLSDRTPLVEHRSYFIFALIRSCSIFMASWCGTRLRIFLRMR